jgi:peptide methionine sulfoxide reductase MsrA
MSMLLVGAPHSGHVGTGRAETATVKAMQRTTTRAKILKVFFTLFTPYKIIKQTKTL